MTIVAPKTAEKANAGKMAIPAQRITLKAIETISFNFSGCCLKFFKLASVKIYKK